MNRNPLTRSLLGLLGGLLVGGAVVVLAIAASVLSAVTNSRDSTVFSIVRANYTAGAAGGFDLSVSTGVAVVVAVAAVLGALAPLAATAVGTGRRRNRGLGSRSS